MIVKIMFYFASCGMGIRIQPMSALVHVVKGDYSRDMNCHIPPAHRITCFLVCSEAYEFGQLGTEFPRLTLFFFSSPAKCYMGFVGGCSNITIVTALGYYAQIFYIVL